MFLETAGPFHSLDKAVIVHATRSLTRNSHSASEAVSRRFQHNLQGQGKGLSINTGNTSQAHNTHSSSWIATEENLGGGTEEQGTVYLLSHAQPVTTTILLGMVSRHLQWHRRLLEGEVTQFVLMSPCAYTCSQSTVPAVHTRKPLTC